jgi:hypothetical protein
MLVSLIFLSYTLKKARHFPVPSRDVTYQTFPSLAGTGKYIIFFYSICSAVKPSVHKCMMLL